MNTLAIQAVSLLVPYLKTLGQKAVDAIGSKLYELVKARFISDPELSKIFKSLEESPDDVNKQLEVQSKLQTMIETDNSFGKQVADIINNNCQIKTGNTEMKTDVHDGGHIEKSISVGTIIGNSTIS
ncbi:MAG: hypothetical protein QX189_10535 [Methylococcales bacterium]